MSRKRPRHAWKGALHRSMYALLFTADREWLRVFYFGPGEWLMVNLDGEVVDPGGETAEPEPLTARLVRAVVDELREDDPFVRIAVGDTVVRLDWEPNQTTPIPATTTKREG